jgi:hypothetical protein
VKETSGCSYVWISGYFNILTCAMSHIPSQPILNRHAPAPFPPHTACAVKCRYLRGDARWRNEAPPGYVLLR